MLMKLISHVPNLAKTINGGGSGTLNLTATASPDSENPAVIEVAEKLQAMGSLIRRGGFVSAFSQPMTHNCEWLTVGGQPVADSTAQKTAQEKLLVTRNGHPSDVILPSPHDVFFLDFHPPRATICDANACDE